MKEPTTIQTGYIPCSEGIDHGNPIDSHGVTPTIHEWLAAHDKQIIAQARAEQRKLDAAKVRELKNELRPWNIETFNEIIEDTAKEIENGE